MLWCADYEGEFLLGNRGYCYPLTITGFASRYLLTCEALLTTQEEFAFTVFERSPPQIIIQQPMATSNSPLFQFGVGCSTESITSSSTGPRAGSSFNPSCS